MGQDCVKLLVKIRAVGRCEELRVGVLGEGEATPGGEKRQEVLEPVLMRKEQTAHCWGIRADREERFRSRDAPGCPRMPQRLGEQTWVTTQQQQESSQRLSVGRIQTVLVNKEVGVRAVGAKESPLGRALAGWGEEKEVPLQMEVGLGKSVSREGETKGGL